ncbi:sporulation protein [Melghirimyces algeriensis]|uniref:Sporulation-control protein n=1 Tax=Melghirimyces algeriensis TaxID=910412 RepID=A0A521DFN0_9BACL|nr:sporulation protein [Melghirimyces algeriensis]SMO70604.1 sporulation-control protein [Melghirimyces algeriensis]
MFRKLLAKLGKGGAKVDLLLEREEYRPGDSVNGELMILGGTIDQKINGIEVDLQLTVRVKEKTFRHTIQTFPFPEIFSIRPGEQRSFPFSCTLPKDLPVSGNLVSYSFSTRLEISEANDHLDHDFIRVLPPRDMQQVLKAFSNLGFREKYDSRSFNGHAQKFDLFPTNLLQGKLKRIEFAAAINDAGVRLPMEVEIRSEGGAYKIRTELFLEHDVLENEERLTQTLKQVLLDMAESPPGWYLPNQELKQESLSWGNMIGGFAAGALGSIVLAELADEALDHQEDGQSTSESGEEFVVEVLDD